MRAVIGKKMFYLAAGGWGSALLIHCLALASVDVTSFAPYVWLLHVGVFVVWIPAVLLLRRANAQQEELVVVGARPSPVREFKQAPRWLAVIAFVGMAYAFLNLMLLSAKSTGEENGQYYTHIHGHDHQPITRQEYHRLQANELRGFSALWIGFYGMAMTMLWPLKKVEESEEPECVVIG